VAAVVGRSRSSLAAAYTAVADIAAAREGEHPGSLGTGRAEAAGCSLLISKLRELMSRPNHSNVGSDVDEARGTS
jgi:hypothetical protein